MMKNFSHRHKLHLSLAGLYALALLRILHVIRYSMLFSFSFSFVPSPTDTRNTGADPRPAAVWNPH